MMTAARARLEPWRTANSVRFEHFLIIQNLLALLLGSTLWCVVHSVFSVDEKSFDVPVSRIKQRN